MNKVVRGQQVRISARDVNAQIDAIKQAQRTITRGPQEPATDTRNGIVLVRNMSGAGQPQFAVMKIDAITVPHSTNASEFFYRFGFDVDVPDADSQDNICVLQEPIADGSIGEAMIVGVTPALIDNTTPSTAGDCGVVSGNVYLTAGKTGALSMPGIEAGSPPTWGLVRLGKSKGGGTGNSTALLVGKTNVSSLSGSQTIDGTATAAGDIVLLTGQTTGSQNGLWVAASGAWTRGTATITTGMLVSITGGSSLADTIWILNTAGTITVGTTSLSFVQSGNDPNALLMVVKAKAASATTSGAQTVDTIACTAGDFVLIGTVVYLVQSGAWISKGTPKAVFVYSGSVNGPLSFAWNGTAYVAMAGAFT